MSFSFTAIGTKEEVVTQLETTDTYDNKIGADAKRLIIAALEADTAKPTTGCEYRYVVQAHGHSGGGSPLALTLSLQTHHVTNPASK